VPFDANKVAGAAKSAGMRGVLVRLGARAIKDAQDTVRDELGMNPGQPIDAAATRRILRGVAARIVNIEDTTRERVRGYVERANNEGWGIDQLAKAIREDISGAFDKRRARTIARTESAVTYNQASAAGWRDSGLVEKVVIVDGLGCGWESHDDPDEADGTIRTLEEFEAQPISHPNCVRSAFPFVEELGIPSRPPRADEDGADDGGDADAGDGTGFVADDAGAEARPELSDESEAEWLDSMGYDPTGEYEDGPVPDVIRAFSDWSIGGYRDIRALQSGVPIDEEREFIGPERAKTALAHMEQALATSPRFNGTVYRGFHDLPASTIDDWIAAAKAGRGTVFDVYASASADGKVAAKFANAYHEDETGTLQRAVWEIHTRSATNITPLASLKDEREILLWGPSRYAIAYSGERDGIHRFVLTEVE
jgi:hypothetical protein